MSCAFARGGDCVYLLSMDIEEKIIGCVLGMAVGDALGGPLDGAKPGAIRSNFRVVADYVDAEELLGGKLARWRTPGMYSCHTQQGLAFLDVCLERRGFNAEAAAGALVKLSRGDSVFQYGVLRGAPADLRTAIDNLKPGAGWRAASVLLEGTSPAARVAPVAVYHADDEHILRDKIIESCAVTHRSPVTVSATAAAAFLVMRGLSMDEAPPAAGRREMVEEAALFCRETELRMAARYPELFEGLPDAGRLHLFSGSLGLLAGRLEDAPERAGEWIAANANPHTNIELKRPTLDFPLASVLYAVYAFAANCGDFERAAVCAINQGGASAAIGAIVCAAAGALHGERGIPERWLKGLANRKQVKARAVMLAGRRFQRAAGQDLYEMEYSLTRKEHEEREARIRKSRKAAPGAERKKAKPAAEGGKEEKFDRKKYERQLQKQKRLSREKLFQGE